jgi:hypothetical protein
LTRRSRRPLPRASRVAFGAGLLVAAFTAASGIAGAVFDFHDPSKVTSPRAGAETNVFVFSGALMGKLKVAPGSDCNRALPHGVTLNIKGKLKGSTSNEWEIQVVSPKDGTFTLPEGENAGIVVSSSPQDQVWGSNSEGTASVRGTKGSVEVELWSTDAGMIHLAGAWNCPPSLRMRRARGLPR